MDNSTMNRVYSFILIFIFTLSLFPSLVNAQTPKEPVWTTPDPVIDLAVSSDGSIVVISNYSHVKVFNGDGSLLWSYRLNPDIEVSAVDVSRDGNAVVAAFYDGFNSYILFWDNAAGLSGTPSPTWFFSEINGYVSPNSLAIAGNGNAVVAAFYNGTHSLIAYWNETLSLSDIQPPTWWSELWDGGIGYVDISFTGLFVIFAALTMTPTPSATLFLVEALYLSGLIPFTIMMSIPIGAGPGIVDVNGLALSDDGMYAVVSYYNDASGYSVYYYDFTYTPYKYWETEFEPRGVGGVDISSDGSVVVATVSASYPVFMYYASHSKPDYSLIGDFYFGPSNISFYHVPSSFSNGSMISPDVNVSVDDWLARVSISGDGSLAVAGNIFTIFTESAVYAASDDGELLWYNSSLTPISDHVEVSHDGSTAVTGGSDFDSLYYFQVGGPGPTLVGGEAYITAPSTGLGVAATVIIAFTVVGVFLLARKRNGRTS